LSTSTSNRAEPGDRLGHHRLHVARVADVGLERLDRATAVDALQPGGQVLGLLAATHQRVRGREVDVEVVEVLGESSLTRLGEASRAWR
jgi:hypothetical protein